jgi:hypothetical protein
MDCGNPRNISVMISGIQAGIEAINCRIWNGSTGSDTEFHIRMCHTFIRTWRFLHTISFTCYRYHKISYAPFLRVWWCIQKFPDWPPGARTAIVEVSMAVTFFTDRVASPVLQPPTWGSTHFSRLLRHAWATVGLSLQFMHPPPSRSSNWPISVILRSLSKHPVVTGLSPSRFLLSVFNS